MEGEAVSILYMIPYAIEKVYTYDLLTWHLYVVLHSLVRINGPFGKQRQ
jgi:hypothetical protein